MSCFDLPSGQPRWSRDEDPILPFKTVLSRVLSDEILLIVVDEFPRRGIGYRLTDGQPVFDVDLKVPYQARIAHYGDGVLVLTTGGNERRAQQIVVYADARHR